jgi:hypothetical protein
MTVFLRLAAQQSSIPSPHTLGCQPPSCCECRMRQMATDMCMRGWASYKVPCAWSCMLSTISGNVGTKIYCRNNAACKRNPFPWSHDPTHHSHFGTEQTKPKEEDHHTHRGLLVPLQRHFLHCMMQKRLGALPQRIQSPDLWSDTQQCNNASRTIHALVHRAGHQHLPSIFCVQRNCWALRQTHSVSDYLVWVPHASYAYLFKTCTCAEAL